MRGNASSRRTSQRNATIGTAKWLRWRLVLAALALGCNEASTPSPPNTVPKGRRVLSLDVNQAETQNYDAAFGAAYRAGIRSVSLALDWGTIETTAGRFDFSNVDIANIYYPAAGVQVGLSVRPVSTTYRTVPADLAARTLDDPVMIQRFNALLDSLHTRLPAVALSGLYLGSEHDVFFGVDSVAWGQWAVFYAATRTHAKSLWPAVPIGTEFTYEGLTGPAARYAARSNTSSDVIAVSYYPLEGGFQVRSPGEVTHGFDTIAAAYPGRPIHYNQVGYPSSDVNGSSDEMQRQFVVALFAAWDAHADQVTLVNINWLTDLSQAAVDAFQDLYDLHNPQFAEFLRSLGLRRYPGSGVDKPAWTELVKQAAMRGW